MISSFFQNNKEGLLSIHAKENIGKENTVVDL